MIRPIKPLYTICFTLWIIMSSTMSFAQNDPCEPSAVLASFEAAALSGELETWIQRFQNSDCSASVKAGVRVLAQGFNIITQTSITGSGAEFRQWASSATATSQYGSNNWSAAQATEAPNTSRCGDYGTAWASRNARGQDRLTVYFEQAVIPTRINIHQTYNPGSIISVSLINADTGEEIELPDSASTNRACPNVFQLTLELANMPPVNGIIISLDQTIGGGWNEIDAVELVGFSVE